MYKLNVVKFQVLMMYQGYVDLQRLFNVIDNLYKEILVDGRKKQFLWNQIDFNQVSDCLQLIRW